MKILITGAKGLLGSKLMDALKSHKDIQTFPTARSGDEKLDVCDATEVKKVLASRKPDVLIHTAAATQVDWCETHEEDARRINVEAVRTIAGECQKLRIHLIHMSSDFIFDGQNGPYREEDQPHPLSVYGKTKLESEEIVKKMPNDSWTIIRTMLVYGALPPGMSRSNVVLWVKSELEQGKRINVVMDQFRAPTLAEDLAQTCLAAAEKKATGIYHACGADLMSIFELAQKTARFFGLEESLIRPVRSEEILAPAKRPPKTGFVLEKARKGLNYSPRTFVQGLEVVQNQLARFKA